MCVVCVCVIEYCSVDGCSIVLKFIGFLVGCMMSSVWIVKYSVLVVCLFSLNVICICCRCGLWCVMVCWIDLQMNVWLQWFVRFSFVKLFSLQVSIDFWYFGSVVSLFLVCVIWVLRIVLMLWVIVFLSLFSDNCCIVVEVGRCGLLLNSLLRKLGLNCFIGWC